MRSRRAQDFASGTRPTRRSRKGFGRQIPSPAPNGQSPTLFIMLACAQSVRSKRSPVQKKASRKVRDRRPLSPSAWRGRVPDDRECIRSHVGRRLASQRRRFRTRRKQRARGAQDTGGQRSACARSRSNCCVRKPDDAPPSGSGYFTTTSAARRASKVTEGPPAWI